MKYAKVESGKVTNIVEVDENDTALIASMGVTACNADTDIGDDYDGTDFSHPAPPERVLADEIEKAIKVAEKNVEAYIDSHYSKGAQSNYIAMLVIANMTGKTACVTYIMGLWAWVQTVMTAHYTGMATMGAASDLATLDAVTIDLLQFDATDPHLSTGVAGGLLV